MAGYKLNKICKVIKSPYTLSQMSELYAIILVWLDYPEFFIIITDSLHADRVVFHTEIVEIVPDKSEITLLFIQLQQAIKS